MDSVAISGFVAEDSVGVGVCMGIGVRYDMGDCFVVIGLWRTDYLFAK